MTESIDLNQIHSRIQEMSRTADELKAMGEDFPALARNIARIQASLKMLELNVSDLVELP